jgi:hypothetical protein
MLFVASNRNTATSRPAGTCRSLSTTTSYLSLQAGYNFSSRDRDIIEGRRLRSAYVDTSSTGSRRSHAAAVLPSFC